MLLAPTPEDRLCDPRGRPYFLWDVDMSLTAFEARLADPAERDYWLSVLLRQAKPDDVFRFVSVDEIVDAVPRLAPRLGRQRAFWTWWVERRRQREESTR